MTSAEDVFRRLTALAADDAKLPKKIITKAFRSGAKLMVSDIAAQGISPLRITSSVKGARGEAAVGIRRAPKKHFTGPTPWLGWLEWGTIKRFTKKGWFRGFISAAKSSRNIIPTAFQQSAQTATDVIVAQVEVGITEAFNK